MEVMVNSNRAAKWDFGGRIYTDRQIRNGMRGRFSELLPRRSTATRSTRK